MIGVSGQNAFSAVDLPKSDRLLACWFIRLQQWLVVAGLAWVRWGVDGVAVSWRQYLYIFR